MVNQIVEGLDGRVDSGKVGWQSEQWKGWLVEWVVDGTYEWIMEGLDGRVDSGRVGWQSGQFNGWIIDWIVEGLDGKVGGGGGKMYGKGGKRERY